MKLKILGSVSPYPKGNMNCPGYLFMDRYYKVLLDCGSGVSRLMNFPEDLNNLIIIISHLHKDHYNELASIAYASYVYHNLGQLPNKVTVYIPEDFESEDFKYLMNFGKEHFMEFKTYNENSTILVNSIEISFKSTIHSIPTYAICLTFLKEGNKRIHYSSDTRLCLELCDFFKNSELLICESSLLENQKNPKLYHLTAKEAGFLAKYSNAKRLILTHFWPEIDKTNYLVEAMQEFKNTYVANEGDIYII